MADSPILDLPQTYHAALDYFDHFPLQLPPETQRVIMAGSCSLTELSHSVGEPPYILKEGHISLETIICAIKEYKSRLTKEHMVVVVIINVYIDV
jgi:hypothetical protein